MAKLIGFRALATLPMLFGIAVLSFALVHLAPTDPAILVLGDGASLETIEAMRAQLGLDQPLLSQFATWLGNAVTGDLGTSLYSNRPVLGTLLERFGITLSLALMSLLVASVVGLAIGVHAARRPGSLLDRGLLAASSLGLAVPSFWLALLLVLLFAVNLGWLPTLGYTRLTTDPIAWAQHLTLPVIALAARPAAIIGRQARNALVRAGASPVVVALRARGVPERTIRYRYTLKNAMTPIISAIGIEATVILAVSFVIERVFAIPGIGSLIIDAVVRNDFPVVQGGVLLVGAAAILVQLLMDVSYGVVNPRARPQ